MHDMIDWRLMCEVQEASCKITDWDGLKCEWGMEGTETH